MRQIIYILGIIAYLQTSIFAQKKNTHYRSTDSIFLLSALDSNYLLYTLNSCKYYDAEKSLSIQQAMSNIHLFETFDSVSSLEKSNEKWLYFTVTNDFPTTERLYLFTKHNDYITLYAIKNGKIQQPFYSGFLEKTKNTPIHENIALNYVELNATDTIQVFIKVYNFLSYHYINNIEIFNESFYHTFDNKKHFANKLSVSISAVFLGSIAFALFFVLFLFYYARSKIYLYYAVYLFSIFLFALPGLKRFPILSEIFHLESNYYFYLYEPSLFLFSGIYGLFVLKILGINKNNYPKIYYFTTISSFIILGYVLFLIGWIHFFRYPYRDILNFISISYVQISSFILLISIFFIQSTYKRIVLIGMSIFFTLGMLAFVLDDILKIKLYCLGYLVNYFLFLKLGILAEVLFFAMALGKRTYILEQEKINNYRNYISELEEKNSLQQKVNQVKIESLRSQINPHFIFNSLNAINYLVLNKENEHATTYIHQFSRLFRTVLDNTRAETISLDDELKMAILYLEIEQKRLSNNFRFNIKKEDSINLTNIKLPSLILQPFLENAIWHGLQHSDVAVKKIEITITENIKNEIQIVIFDNGIGRTEAQKNKSFHKNKSHGIDITSERIQLHNTTNDNKIDFEIIDLPSDKNNIGTAILFTIKDNNLC